MQLFKLFLLLLFFFLTLNAKETLKIVYNSGTPPLKFSDEQGLAKGMFIDIWKLWAQKNSLKVEFIEAPWDETIAMIKDGRADIHAGIYYTKERDEFLDYTSFTLYNNKKYFFYHNSVGSIEKVDDLKPYVIGIDNGYPNIFMKNDYPNYAIKSFSSANAANKAFFNEELKVVLASIPTFFYYIKQHNLDEKEYLYNENTYAYSKQYFGAVKQGNKRLLSKINSGFKKITNEELNLIELQWTKELDLKSVSSQENPSFLTKDQQEYLKKKATITMCVDPSWLPFEMIKDNKHYGMVADIFETFQKKLNVPIKLVATSSWSESLSFAKSQKCDILSAAAATPQRKKYMNFTKPYLKFPEVIVTREKEPFIDNIEDILSYKIGVVKNSAVAELLKKKYPNINLVPTKNVTEGLFKVSSGELYGFINTTAAVSYSIAKNGMTNLKIAAKVGIDYYLRIAVRNDDIHLLNIFNQLIYISDKEEVKTIKDKWLTVKMEEVIDYSLVYQIFGWFVLIVLFILFWNRKLKKEIDERKLVQEELNKFLQVIEQSQVSIMLTNKQGVIEYVNPFCVNETGYTYAEFVGANPSIVKSGFQDETFYQELWKTILSGKTWHGEFSNKKKNGELFWESAIIAPIFDENQTIKYFASIKEDVTEKVRVQKELEIAQKEANLANQAKSDFLAKMSHEIRTPMNAVLGMLYLLEKTQLNSTQENYIKKANGAANSLLGVINDILDFSKIEANKLEIKNAQFNIHMLVNEIMSVMSVEAEQNELELLTYYDKDFPISVMSDSLRLSQILNNLLSNSIKFTKHGEILVSTKLVKQVDNEATLMFCIKDSGIGITKENQSKLFQEFSQVDDSATRNFQGTGLGLAICKKLTQLLGGDIWIEDSQIGVGTTICFTIKVKTMSIPLVTEFNFPKTMTHLNVLVVDDNLLASKVLKEMLESFEYSVDVVHSGVEAVKKVQEVEYDLVFLDYKMPELNGIETYLEYKDILHEKTPRTLMVTAYSQELVEKDIEEFGLLGYLTKPISPSTLYDTIMEALSVAASLPSSGKKNDEVIESSLEGVTVLLVEDNLLNQDVAVSMLEAHGLNVVVANDGLEAIEKIKTKAFTLVLMDIQMPQLDGLEATKRIRNMEDDYFKQIPIIALSANALVGDREKSLLVGMNEHITKPINPQELFETLQEFIDDVQPLEVKEGEVTFQHLQRINSDILDTKQAMIRMANNEKAYLKILEQFYLNYHNVCIIIEELIVNKDIEALERKVHELKGIAGNISAHKLYLELGSMSTILHNNKIPSLEMFESFKISLQNVLDEIKNLEQKNMIKSKRFDKPRVVTLLLDIQNHLNIDIVQCVETIEELTPYLQEEHVEFSTQLSTALNEFDTDRASELIELFLKEIDNDK